MDYLDKIRLHCDLAFLAFHANEANRCQYDNCCEFSRLNAASNDTNYHIVNTFNDLEKVGVWDKNSLSEDASFSPQSRGIKPFDLSNWRIVASRLDATTATFTLVRETYKKHAVVHLNKNLESCATITRARDLMAKAVSYMEASKTTPEGYELLDNVFEMKFMRDVIDRYLMEHRKLREEKDSLRREAQILDQRKTAEIKKIAAICHSIKRAADEWESGIKQRIERDNKGADEMMKMWGLQRCNSPTTTRMKATSEFSSEKRRSALSLFSSSCCPILP